MLSGGLTAIRNGSPDCFCRQVGNQARYSILNTKSMEPVNIHRELTTVYGENCMSIQQVRLWCREFSKGRKHVHNAERSGRPSISDAIVAKINEFVREDRRMTIEDIPLRVLDVCPKSVYNILTEKLGYTKATTHDHTPPVKLRISSPHTAGLSFLTHPTVLTWRRLIFTFSRS